MKFLERDGIHENQHFLPTRTRMLYHERQSAACHRPDAPERFPVLGLHLP